MEPLQIASFEAAVANVTAAQGSGSTPAANVTLNSTRVPVSAIGRCCAEHKQHQNEWLDLALLSGPSTEVKKHASRFLMRRPKELLDIFHARQQGFTYTNIIGNGLGWYVAKLFKDTVDVDVLIDGETIDLNESAEHEFYARFLEDCDRAGHSFTEVMKDGFRQLCVFRRSYVLIDLDPEVGRADNAAAQRIEPYLCVFEPSSVINCERDAYGNLQWIVFRTTEDRTPFLGKPETVTRWSYYDKEEFRIYEHSSSDERLPGDTEEMAVLTSSGRHALADYEPYEGAPKGRVPVVDVEVPEILWLGARVYLQALDHLNLENSLKWGIFLGNLAQPVIKTESEIEPTIHESGAIRLSPGDEYSFAEPTGNTFKISQERLDRLREDMYRSMYLQAQGRSESATASAQSGLSKEQDMAPGRDVLNSFGSVMRKHMLLILSLVAAVRQDEDLDFDVRGLQHDDEPLTEDIADAAQVVALGIQSDRFHKEVQKQVVRRYGRTWAQDTVTDICAEIDSAPGKSEVEQADKDREDQQLENKMASSFKLVADDTPPAADEKKEPKKEDK